MLTLLGDIPILCAFAPVPSNAVGMFLFSASKTPGSVGGVSMGAGASSASSADAGFPKLMGDIGSDSSMAGSEMFVGCSSYAGPLYVIGDIDPCSRFEPPKVLTDSPPVVRGDTMIAFLLGILSVVVWLVVLAAPMVALDSAGEYDLGLARRFPTLSRMWSCDGLSLMDVIGDTGSEFGSEGPGSPSSSAALIVFTASSHASGLLSVSA